MKERGSRSLHEIFITDADDNLSDVNIANGVSSTLSIQIAGSPVTSFTGQQLTDGNVSLVRDGSEDSTVFFDLTAEDGDEDLSTPPRICFVSVTPVNDALLSAPKREPRYRKQWKHIN